jgi:hypothetical protein
MNVSISISRSDQITIREWFDRGNDVIGWKVRVRRPGEFFAGRPYEYWRQLAQQLGAGWHEVPDADEHRTVFLNTSSPDVIEKIQRAERPLTFREFENAPMPDRPVVGSLPEDWQQPGPGGHTVPETEGGKQ